MDGIMLNKELQIDTLFKQETSRLNRTLILPKFDCEKKRKSTFVESFSVY